MIPSLLQLVSRRLGRSARLLPADRKLVVEIRGREAELRTKDDGELRQFVDPLRDAVRLGVPVTSRETLVPALALVSEAVRRTLGYELYDVQLLGGLVLTRGAIAEMQTGEGKTLVAALPAFVHALTGRCVHVMTVNSYLAERDHEQLAPVFEFLGMTTSLLVPRQQPDAKREVYRSDIVYGPGYEFGFDFLRDQLWTRPRVTPLGQSVLQRLAGQAQPRYQPIQTGHAFAVVDEADSVMLDEATTPLVLSQQAGASAPAQIYLLALQTASSLREKIDFVLDVKRRSIMLTTPGMERVTETAERAGQLGIDRPWARYVELALHAKHYLHRDVDYTLTEGEVQIVDSGTGRIFADRSWREGLHQAVQAKESVEITSEQRPMARITRQRFFALYDGLCGMTGTATGSEREFSQVYRLPVTPIPTHRPGLREEYPSRFFATDEARWNAVLQEVQEVHQTGRPILVGTRTIEESQRLAGRLQSVNLPFQLLNGKQDDEEAEIVAQAGRTGVITIATNMAGRGTDIKLGSGVTELGGLHVVACARHESPRVDRQLAGRAARQGDPGSVRFFVAAIDPLVTDHARRVAKQIAQAATPGGEYSGDLSSVLAAAQRRAERKRFRQRLDLYRHDDWLDQVNAQLAGKK